MPADIGAAGQKINAPTPASEAPLLDRRQTARAGEAIERRAVSPEWRFSPRGDSLPHDRMREP
jgi:hypothetical protein